jgi:cyanate permease
LAVAISSIEPVLADHLISTFGFSVIQAGLFFAIPGVSYAIFAPLAGTVPCS